MSSKLHIWGGESGKKIGPCFSIAFTPNHKWKEGTKWWPPVKKVFIDVTYFKLHNFTWYLEICDRSWRITDSEKVNYFC